MITDEQAKQLLDELEKEFGEKLPNPEYYPNSFLYYAKLHNYLKNFKKDTNQ